MEERNGTRRRVFRSLPTAEPLLRQLYSNHFCRNFVGVRPSDATAAFLPTCAPGSAAWAAGLLPAQMSFYHWTQEEKRATRSSLSH